MPPFATAHTFCASRDGIYFLRNLVPRARVTLIQQSLPVLMDKGNAGSGNEIDFCAVYNYAGKAGLRKGYGNAQRK